MFATALFQQEHSQCGSVWNLVGLLPSCKSANQGGQLTGTVMMSACGDCYLCGRVIFEGLNLSEVQLPIAFILLAPVLPLLFG